MGPPFRVIAAEPVDDGFDDSFAELRRFEGAAVKENSVGSRRIDALSMRRRVFSQNPRADEIVARISMRSEKERQMFRDRRVERVGERNFAEPLAPAVRLRVEGDARKEAVDEELFNLGAVGVECEPSADELGRRA